MKIDRIQLKNFKLFEEFELPLHPEFTLLIGENGSGKTSILDALAIACGVWLYEVPDKNVHNSRVPLSVDHVRVEWQTLGDRPQFVPSINESGYFAHGTIGDQKVKWSQTIVMLEKFSTGLEPVRSEIARLIKAAVAGNQLLPVIAYYGAGRAWLPHRERRKSSEPIRNPRSRWEAFYDCLNERIRIADLKNWFADEAIERGNRRNASYRPGFEVVKQAILRCVPQANDAWYDTGRSDIVLSIANKPQPFSNLSAGQQMMVAMVADIAIKCVTQNNFLVPPETLGAEDEPLPRVLSETPGVVLIDEIDVHLHPKWQRRVVEDLRTTFPKIQFVATTHSPFVVQSMREEELRNLHGQAIPDLGNTGVEAISRGLMNVSRPDVSQRYDQMVHTAKNYLMELEEAKKVPIEKLSAYEEALAKHIAPYADNPAFQAFLELKREGKLGQLRSRNGRNGKNEGQ